MEIACWDSTVVTGVMTLWDNEGRYLLGFNGWTGVIEVENALSRPLGTLSQLWERE